MDWQRYLNSICRCREYADGWACYTLTDVTGRKREERSEERSPLPFLELDLQVETVTRANLEAEERDRLRWFQRHL